VNQYAHVDDDPVNVTDPSGLGAGGCVSGGFVGDPPSRDNICTPSTQDADPWFGSDWFYAGSPAAFGSAEGAFEASSSSRQPATHVFSPSVRTPCSADEAMRRLMRPSLSAPNAPQAREGITLHIALAGNNPITQVVNFNEHTILNVTEPTHGFRFGTVLLHVSPLSRSESEIRVLGTGVNLDRVVAMQNEAVGTVFFGGVIQIIAASCQIHRGEL
jgi:hypothetical protein